MAKVKVLITDELARAMPLPSGRLTRVWDSRVAGFGFYATPAGARSYFLLYRHKGRERCITLGKVGQVACHAARKKALTTLAEVLDGEDPLEARQRERAAMRLDEFWRQYVQDAATRWKPRTQAFSEDLWANRIAPEFGSRRLEEITRPAISAWHRRQLATPTRANHALAVLRACLNKAVAWGILEKNPATMIAKFRSTKREVLLSREELLCLWAAIERLEDDGGQKARPRIEDGNADAEQLPIRRDGRPDRRYLPEAVSRGISPHAAGFFKLALLTGCRASELLTAKWSMVRWDRAVLALEDAKAGRRDVPLSQPALAVLQALARLRTEGVEWIVEGRESGARLINYASPWERVKDRAAAILAQRRKDAGLAEVDGNRYANLHVHDLRHACATLAVSAGLSTVLVGKLLGHKSLESTARYAHAQSDVVLEAAQLVGATIMELVRDDGGAVVEAAGRGRRNR